VQKGNLNKLAISTNGKSPTVAKRLEGDFCCCVAAQVDDVLNNLASFEASSTEVFMKKK